MSTDNPMIPLSAMRAIAVEAIRAVTGCPDIRGNEGRYLVDELEAVAKAAAEALKVSPQRAELVAAWNDLPDSIRCHPGLKRLFRACQVA